MGMSAHGRFALSGSGDCPVMPLVLRNLENSRRAARLALPETADCFNTPATPFFIMFVTTPRLFLNFILKNKFAVPSFNVSNLEMARAVIEAAELEDAPVMVRTDLIHFYYAG